MKAESAEVGWWTLPNDLCGGSEPPSEWPAQTKGHGTVWPRLGTESLSHWASSHPGFCPFQSRMWHVQVDQGAARAAMETPTCIIPIPWQQGGSLDGAFPLSSASTHIILWSTLLAQLCSLPAAWPRTSYSNFRNLHFLNCNNTCLVG